MSPRVEFYRLSFDLRAIETIKFPQNKAGNVLRGAFGTTLRQLTSLYAPIFEPADGPRPFVFRAAHLDGCTFGPGAAFSFGMNVFGQSESTLLYFARAFALLESEGLGPSRGRASLTNFEQHRHCLPLLPDDETVSRLEVRFDTPTELKNKNGVISEPSFPVLIRRIVERINALGAPAIQLDERGIGERAAAAQMTECRIQHVKVDRVSSRTGQTHPLGGFVGEAVYEGELAEFLPLLRAAEVTGVGRHTSWGNGQLRVRVLR